MLVADKEAVVQIFIWGLTSLVTLAFFAAESTSTLEANVACGHFKRAASICPACRVDE